MSAREKIAYLRGLIDGQKVADTPEKEKFFAALVDALDSLAEAMEEHEEVHNELNDYLEQLDEEEYASVTCPECGKDFYYEPAAYDEDEDLLCPHCGKPFKYPED